MAVQPHHRSVLPLAESKRGPRRRRGGGDAAVASLPRRILRILARTGKAFLDDSVTRLGAALAYYTTVAVAPLLVLAVMVAGFFFEETEAREKVIGEIASLAGSHAGKAIESVQAVQSPANSAAGRGTTAIGIATLLFGAFGVFHHLQEALNSIWRVKPAPTKGWRAFLRQRLFSFATVMGTGFLLLVSLVASAMLSWLSGQALARWELPTVALQTVNNLLSFGMLTFLFAMVFKLLPDTTVQWRHVWLGAVVTALLFTVGKSLLGLYLGRANVASGYGAARSLIVLLLWCYYAAQIVFLGAEFTRVTALSHGGRDFSPLNDPVETKRAA
jgi:membrane protein